MPKEEKLREHLLRFYAFMQDKDYDEIVNEYLGKNADKNWTNKLYMGVERTIANISEDYQPIIEKAELEARIDELKGVRSELSAWEQANLDPKGIPYEDFLVFTNPIANYVSKTITTLKSKETE